LHLWSNTGSKFLGQAGWDAGHISSKCFEVRLRTRVFGSWYFEAIGSFAQAFGPAFCQFLWPVCLKLLGFEQTDTRNSTGFKKLNK